jgi:hypothetical protein
MIYDRGAQEIEIEVRLVTDIVRWVGANVCLAQPPFHAVCWLRCSERSGLHRSGLSFNQRCCAVVVVVVVCVMIVSAATLFIEIVRRCCYVNFALYFSCFIRTFLQPHRCTTPTWPRWKPSWAAAP